MPSVASAIEGNKEDGYNFTCPLDVFGNPRKEGSAAPPCGFTSLNWPVKGDLEERVKMHVAEHQTLVPMPELIEVDPRRSDEERAQALQDQTNALDALKQAKDVVDGTEESA